ncbi:serine hydrolase domain-containing protein [Polaribacter sp. Hel1_85]|uniref:serine hydrolase domain-containing protein n=1 Tax=Polaribacter sp. Hel1_85 TaxID=1250005 RepID=UPI00052DB1CB|nr:serine hydrolase [Polaribacter sp. Hel1_85]KGL63956.1 beta-lactamase like protein [Polaribacter sp. Hel1_85]
MKIPFIYVFLFFLILNSNPFFAQGFNKLKIGNKEKLGFSHEKLDSLTSFLKKSGSSSLIILSNGKAVLEWGQSNKKHTIHSIRKALLNSLLGIYITNGTIDTTKTLSDLKIDDISPKLTEQEKKATIADILKSKSGVYHNAAAVSKGMLNKMPKRGSHYPGETYYYNNWGFNILGHILEQQTGKSIYDLYYQHIAQPLEMDFVNEYSKIYVTKNEDVEIPDSHGFYQYELEKSKYPAYHFRMSARDLALYGQLYLNKGKWKGRQIIPKEWIDYSVKPYSITYKPAGLAYGILWGVLMKTKNRPSNSFYHTGTGVHMLAIYPDSNMVLVHRVDTESDYTFSEDELYEMISLVWQSKID